MSNKKAQWREEGLSQYLFATIESLVLHWWHLKTLTKTRLNCA